jgi:hypothetical protein
LEKGSTERAEDYTCLHGQGNENHHLGTFRKFTASHRAGFVRAGMSYIVQRGRWCDIVLNVRAPTEDNITDSKFVRGLTTGILLVP